MTFHVYVTGELPESLVKAIRKKNWRMVNQSPQPIIITSDDDSLNGDSITTLFAEHGFTEVEAHQVERR